MIPNKVLIAGAVLGAIAAGAIVAEPVQAGTCVPVEGRAADPATATTKASIKLTQRAASLRGRIGGCLPIGPKSSLPVGGDAMVT